MERSTPLEVRGIPLNLAFIRDMPPGPDLTLYVLGTDSEYRVYLTQKGKSMVAIEPPIRFGQTAEDIIRDWIDFIEHDKSPADVRQLRMNGIGPRPLQRTISFLP
jgi:hypothetical protein